MNGASSDSGSRHSLLNFISVLVKWRWLLIRNFILVAVLSVIVSLLWPKTYKSDSIIIPPETNSGGLTSILGGFSINVLDESQITTANYETIINSVRLRKKLIKKFNLFEVYGIEKFESMMKLLNQNIEVEKGLAGGIGYLKINSLKISVYDKSATRAAEMNNYIIDELNKIITEINTKKAQKVRQFIEGRYLTVLKDLADSENKLKVFQQKTGLLVIPDQIKVIIEQLAQLRMDIAKLEIEKQILIQSVGNHHPDVKKFEIRVRGLQQEYERLKTGQTFEKSGLLVPFNHLPEYAVEYIRLKRDIEIQSKLLEFLLPQFEKAKIQEQKAIPSFHILDEARVPDYKFKPKRALIVLISVFSVMLLSWLYIFTVEYKRRIVKEQPEVYSEIENIVELLKDNFLGFKK